MFDGIILSTRSSCANRRDLISPAAQAEIKKGGHRGRPFS
jgi:hypothetical protein